nr:molybdopterin-dependent oxidoreductase [Desulfobacterales bacterium]
MKTEITRRSFLKQSSLVIAATAFSGPLTLFNASPLKAASELPFKPHAFLEIATDDTITVWVGQTNLGQGTHTGIPMVLADELDADWKLIQVKPAPAGEPFKDPLWHSQFTGGSTSIRHRWDLLRTVGAAARQMLVEAAAQQWGITAGRFTTENGQVVHSDGRRLSYGKLVATAQ